MSTEMEQNITKSPKIKVGEYPVISELINNMPVNLVGVNPTAEFFEKNYGQLKGLVEKSGVLILERAAFDEKSFVGEMAEIFLDFDNFYGKIAKIAETKPKKISIANPATPKTEFFLGEIFGDLSFLAAAGYITYEGAKILYKKKINRRDILVGGAIGLENIVLGGQGIIPNKALSAIGKENVTSTYNPYKLNIHDWQNVTTADAIDLLSILSPDSEQPITYIGNADNQNTIAALLKEKTKERISKKELYNGIFKSINYWGSRKSIRNYEYINYEWQLTSKIPLVKSPH